MKSRRNLVAIAAGLLLGLLSLFVGLHAIQQYESARVVVVTRPVAPGSRLSANDLSEISVPIGGVPKRAITIRENAIGKYSTTQLFPGEYLLQDHVQANPSRVPDIRTALLNGVPSPKAGQWRVISIRLAPEAALNGDLLPGDRIDLYYLPAGEDPLLLGGGLLVLSIRNSQAGPAVSMEDGGFSAPAGRIPNTISLQVPAALVSPILARIQSSGGVAPFYAVLAARP